jgi:hypothetical protein
MGIESRAATSSRASILLLAASLLCASIEAAADLPHGHGAPAEIATLDLDPLHDTGEPGGAMDHCAHCLHVAGMGEAGDVHLFRDGSVSAGPSPSYVSRPDANWYRPPPGRPPIEHELT